MSERSPTSRRTILSASAVSLTALAGCTAFGSRNEKRRATLDRIVVRSDTGDDESPFLTLVYAPRDDSTERPIWGVHEAPASGRERAITDFEGSPGFYSLTAFAENHDNLEIASFNSYGDAVGDTPLQFEVVVEQTGDVWTNVDEAGENITHPG
ncbi:hypothetical protein [Haladaptatus sp. NG-WS-4]